jgi:hypothetical protein
MPLKDTSSCQSRGADTCFHTVTDLALREPTICRNRLPAKHLRAVLYEVAWRDLDYPA